MNLVALLMLPLIVGPAQLTGASRLIGVIVSFAVLVLFLLFGRKKADTAKA